MHSTQVCVTLSRINASRVPRRWEERKAHLPLNWAVQDDLAHDMAGAFRELVRCAGPVGCGEAWSVERQGRWSLEVYATYVQESKTKCC